MRSLLITVILTLISGYSFSQSNRVETILPYNLQTERVLYEKIDTSIFNLPKIVSVSKDWIASHWNYSNVIKFESENKLIFRAMAELPYKSGNIYHRISIELKDNKFKFLIDDIEYSKPNSSTRVIIEKVILDYLNSVDGLKKEISVDESKLSKSKQREHKERVEILKKNAEFHRNILYLSNLEYNKYIDNYLFFLNKKNGDW